ncbi:MAG: hypothetical protein LPK85_10280, partial [Gammaproteobacteria bacterium]|nr:hypothetical protein [Gammaproteobacteria bacterium]
MRTFSKSILFSSLLALVLPNLLFWAAAQYFGVGRSVFNLDYILVVAVMALGFWRTGLLLVAIMMIVDALCLVVQV